MIQKKLQHIGVLAFVFSASLSFYIDLAFSI